MREARSGWLDAIRLAAAQAHARHQRRRFLRAADRAPSVQRDFLMDLLRRNRGSTFARDHGFDTIRSVADFQHRVPIRGYEGFAPYIEEVKAGRVDALFAPGERVLMFALTSGSTDAPKYIPVTPAFVRQYRRGWNIFGIQALADHPGCFLRGIVQVTSPMDSSHTPAGVPCGSISGLLARSQKRIVRRYYVVPPGVAYLGDSEARYYAVMRFAAPRDVAFMVTASPATQLRLARMARDHAERLIRDVRDGTLSPPGAPLDPSLIETFAGALTPDPASARRLEACANRRGELLPRDFWNLGFLANWMGGTMGLYLRDFPRFFGDTPVRDIGLLATEGRVTVGMKDHTPAGVLDVEGGFFEFLDPDTNGADGGDPAHRADALLCHQLETGREYRVVITNDAGLYRYDIGDRVRVVDVVGRAPVLEFLHRGSRVSSVTGEKITEWQVTEAFRRCYSDIDAAGVAGTNTDEHGSALFVLAPHWGDPPHYVLHVEDRAGGNTRSEPSPDGAEVPLAERFDRALCAINLEYASKRTTGRLGPVVVHRLPPGFLARRDARLGRDHEQFKHQYLVTRPDQDADLAHAGTQPPRR